MTENKNSQEVATKVPTNIEEHGIDPVAAVAAGAAVVSAGATVYQAVQNRKPPEPPPPEPPKIELPPGVDKD